MAWQVIALAGFIFYATSRWVPGTRPPNDFDGFGVWRSPPRWAHVLFSGNQLRIRWDTATWELMGLVWLGLGTVGWICQPPAGSDLELMLGLPMVGSVVVMAVTILLITVRRRG